MTSHSTTTAQPGSATHRRAVHGYRFASFEANLPQWELRKRGLRIRLQKKPFQILSILLERRGELVTRAELARELWPDLHVEYEKSLNTAMNCLREALGDSLRSSRYIETVPGHGYRFIAPAEAFLLDSPGVAAPARPLDSPAEADYIRGRFFYNKMSGEGFARASAYFASALRLDPQHAPSHASLAGIQTLLASWSVLPTERAAVQARAHAQSAVAANPRSAVSHTALANSARLLARSSSEIESHYLDAVAAPDCGAEVHMFYGEFLCCERRVEEAVRHLQRAVHLDALSLIVHFKLAWVLTAARESQAALEHSWETLLLEPGFAPAQYTLGMAYQQLGMLDEAITEFDNARRCSDEHPATVASMAHAQAAAGHSEEAEANRAYLTLLATDRYVSPYWFALADAGLQRYTEAQSHLASAKNADDLLLRSLWSDSRFDGYRAALFG